MMPWVRPLAPEQHPVLSRLIRIDRSDLVARYVTADAALLSAMRHHQFIDGISNRYIADQDRKSVVAEMERALGLSLTDGLVIVRPPRTRKTSI
jgi:hypothetical protein